MKLLLLLFPIHAIACSNYVIGFKGLNDVFDHASFNQYANHLGACAKVYKWHQYIQAVQFVEQNRVKYTVYGFSKGAEATFKFMQLVGHKPTFIVTVGAHGTTNVNFSQFGVEFLNVFDYSGKGQQSPGIHLSVSHYKIQQEANKYLIK
jgi:hypothetical protein